MSEYGVRVYNLTNSKGKNGEKILWWLYFQGFLSFFLTEEGHEHTLHSVSSGPIHLPERLHPTSFSHPTWLIFAS